MTSMLNMNEIGILDRQILQLHDYKPIPENEVKNLCDKVSWKFWRCYIYDSKWMDDNKIEENELTSHFQRHFLFLMA